MADRMIFLSHRFADKRIADVVRRHLGLWGFDTQCYQASAPGLGPKAGEFITLDIKEALYEAKLVILIYTLTDYDWSFCMWECGLATHPTKTDTRTIVLQCNPNDTPRIFANQLLIEASEEGIHNFTIQFFREEGFFPGRPALRPDITDAVVADYSHAFYAELIASIPPGQHEERYRWDYITLQITNADVDIKMFREHGAVTFDALAEKCHVVSSFGTALKHFGYADVEPDLNLERLLHRWTQKSGDHTPHANEWIDELKSELFRAIDNEPASPQWKSMKSAHFTNDWFYPVVNHVRVLPDGSMQFDIYFYRSVGAEERSARD